MFNSNCASIPLVANIDGGCNRNDGMFGGDGWWAIIIFALIFGWGGNGFGWGGNNGRDGYPCATQADVRAAVDQQTLISKLDQQTYGLASSTYDLNNTIMNGFHGVDNAICTLGYQVQQGFNGVERGQNALQAQLASCCCETQREIERGFADVGYRMATDTCAIHTNASNNTRDIIDAMNCGFRGIEARLTAQEMAAKDAQIAAQNQKIFGLELAASQCAQNNYIVSQLRPAPIPAYNVPNPWNYGNNDCGCGCGCGYRY